MSGRSRNSDQNPAVQYLMAWRLSRGRILSNLCRSLLVATLLTACSSQPTRAPSTYTVRAGDTLYRIATRYGLDYRELARLNRIGRDYVIYPGQVLRLTPGRAVADVTPRVIAPPATAAPPTIARSWRWPADDTVVASTSRPNGGRGLTLKGRAGQPVKAAGDGHVVYVGTGLLGYGQLVIIKHDEVYLSAYGHTETVHVEEGARIVAGQTIATMGLGPGSEPMLYFEIRADGKPTDPLLFLPQGN